MTNKHAVFQSTNSRYVLVLNQANNILLKYNEDS